MTAAPHSSRAQELRSRASSCRREAEESTYPDLRKRLLELAEIYDRAAVNAEAQEEKLQRVREREMRRNDRTDV